jgi:hypothetical protein
LFQSGSKEDIIEDTTFINLLNYFDKSLNLELQIYLILTINNIVFKKSNLMRILKEFDFLNKIIISFDCIFNETYDNEKSSEKYFENQLREFREAILTLMQSYIKYSENDQIVY